MSSMEAYTSFQASSPQKSRSDFKVGSDFVASGPKGTGLRPPFRDPLWSYASPPPMPPRYMTIDEVSESVASPIPKEQVYEHNQAPTQASIHGSYPWKALVWILLMVFLFLFRLLYILSGFNILASMFMALFVTLLTYLFLRFT